MAGVTSIGTVLQTLGDETNEASVKYKYADVAYEIILLNTVTPDALLVFQSKMVGFRKKLQDDSISLDPVPRQTKRLVLRSII